LLAHGEAAAALGVDPGLAPGLVWVAAAVLDDEPAAESLASRWGADLGRGLLDVRDHLCLCLLRGQGAEAQALLEQEVSGHG
jgi:hypothetical protein